MKVVKHTCCKDAKTWLLFADDGAGGYAWVFRGRLIKYCPFCGNRLPIVDGVKVTKTAKAVVK